MTHKGYSLGVCRAAGYMFVLIFLVKVGLIEYFVMKVK